MAGVTLVKDEFTGLALDADIAGREPPVTNNGADWVGEPASPTVGGGSDDIKFVTGGATKLNTGVTNCAVRVYWYDGGVNNRLWLCLRDTQSTAYPRYGYICVFYPRNGTVGVYYQSNYTSVEITEDIAATFNTGGGVNHCIFEANGSNFRVIVNDVLVHTFSHATYSTGTRITMILQNDINSLARINEVEIYDSYIIPGDPVVSVPIVLAG